MISTQKHSIPSASKIIFSLCIVFTHNHLSIQVINNDAYSRVSRLAGDEPTLSTSQVEAHAEQIQRLGQCHQKQLRALDWLKKTHVSTCCDVEGHRADISRARAQAISLQWYKLDEALNQETDILNTLVERLDKALLLAVELETELGNMGYNFLAIERCYGVIEWGEMWDIEDADHLGFLLEDMDFILEELTEIFFRSAQE